MSQNLKLKVTGLQTNPNQLSGVSEGALVEAKNIVIDKGVAEPRRGFGRLANPTASSSDRWDRLTGFQDKIIGHRSNDNKLAYHNAGWTEFSGTYQHPDSNYARIRFLEASSNLYFTEATGIKVLHAYNGSVYNAGMPKGLDGSASTTGASGFMSDDTQVAYRVVWGSRDEANNLYLGAPSQRIVVSNSSGGTRDVSLTITIPSGITTDDFFQVYRSRESASSSDEPNDELQLCYEANPSAGEITAKSVTFTDSLPLSLLGAALYTNSSQEGIQEENDEPPFAHDICEFKGYMFFANIKRKHALNIKLLAVSGSSGLAANDTITINGVVYTAKVSEDVASAEFAVVTGGSASQNIDDTARSLVKVINQHSANTAIYAYYETGYQDLPGQILLRKRTLDTTAFTVSVSKTSAWDIDDGQSDNEVIQNGLSWGKNQQPEHVPTSHLEYVGSKSYPTRRILALRDSLFILKDDGVFRLTGSAGAWSISALDTSTKILAPDSAVVVNNQILCLADQGIVSISDVGVQVLSEPIKDQLTELVGLNFEGLKTLSYGVAYETDRKYLLNTVSTASDTFCTQSFVMNTFTNQWTRWEKNTSHGFVNDSDDKLYFSLPDEKHVLQERKSFSFRDYIDEEIDGFSIVSSSGTSIVLNSIVGLTEGDLLYESSSTFSPILSIDVTNSTVTVSDTRTWTPGAVTVYKGIDCDVEWTAQHADNPGLEKLWQEVVVLFKENRFLAADLDFFSDVSGAYESVPINGTYGGGGFGLFPWGEVPWGGVFRLKLSRVSVPRNKARSSQLSVRFSNRIGYAYWAIQGLSLQFEYTSERMETV